MMAISGRAFIVGNTDGIGLALTQRLLRDGWSVVGLSRRASPVEDAPGYRHAIADVSAAEYRPALQALLAHEGPFDICVYCAGIGELLDVNDLTGEADVFRVNFDWRGGDGGSGSSTNDCCRPRYFIGLSSIGDGVSSDAPSYSASKAGLSSYLEGLALAVAITGCPGHEPATRLCRHEDGEVEDPTIHDHDRASRRGHLGMSPSTSSAPHISKADGHARVAGAVDHLRAVMVCIALPSTRSATSTAPTPAGRETARTSRRPRQWPV